MCSKCEEVFDSMGNEYPPLCADCKKKEEEEKLEKYISELMKGRSLEEVIIELAKIVCKLENKKPEYVPPPRF